MTRQETFDIVARHLLAQGKPCTDATGDCVYRGPDGLKCAVGCLIPDDKYKGWMEAKAPTHECMLPVMEELGLDAEFCEVLQHVHDELSPDDWRDRLLGVAEDYELSTEALR